MSSIRARAAKAEAKARAAAARANNEAEFGTWMSPFSSYGKLAHPRDPNTNHGGHVSEVWRAPPAHDTSTREIGSGAASGAEPSGGSGEAVGGISVRSALWRVPG